MRQRAPVRFVDCPHKCSMHTHTRVCMPSACCLRSIESQAVPPASPEYRSLTIQFKRRQACAGWARCVQRACVCVHEACDSCPARLSCAAQRRAGARLLPDTASVSPLWSGCTVCRYAQRPRAPSRVRPGAAAKGAVPPTPATRRARVPVTPRPPHERSHTMGEHCGLHVRRRRLTSARTRWASTAGCTCAWTCSGRGPPPGASPARCRPRCRWSRRPPPRAPTRAGCR